MNGMALWENICGSVAVGVAWWGVRAVEFVAIVLMNYG